jgi:hypothetical protein
MYQSETKPKPQNAAQPSSASRRKMGGETIQKEACPERSRRNNTYASDSLKNGVGNSAVSQLRTRGQIENGEEDGSTAAVVQRVITYTGYDGNQSDAVIASIRNFEQKEALTAMSKLEILNGIVKLDQRKENFGTFDLKNYQLVGLLYHQIKRQGKGFEDPEAERNLAKQDKPFKEKQELEADTFGAAKRPDLKIKGFYDLALLGMGSSIGYYISSLGKAYDHKHTIVIGKEDPWKQRRGDIPFVNHPMGMIEPWGKEAPKSEFPTSRDEIYSKKPEDIFASRKGFATKTEEAISAARPAKLVDGSIKKVSKVIDLDEATLRKMLPSHAETFSRVALWDALEWRLKKNNFTLFDYIIETEDGFHAARKVVMGTGGGPHSVPQHTKAENVVDSQPNSTERSKKQAIKSKMMDMDTFIRLPEKEIKGKRVVVQGTNAAIDAADWTIENGGDLVAWLGSKPPFLYKTLLKNAPSSQVEEKRVAADRNTEKIAIQEDGTLKISFKVKAGESTTVRSPVIADYFVYGIGQDIGAQDEASDTSGPKAMLSAEALKDLQKDEALIKGDSAGAFDSSYGLGLHIGNDKRGLSVIGAAAWRLSGGATRGKLDKMAEAGPSNVLSYEQLGALKGAMGAMNSYMPEYIGKGFDWLTADQNMIVAYLTIQHPDTPENVADGFVKAVTQLRKLYPNGVPEDVKQNLLTRKIRSEMATEMALETANFLRRNPKLSREEMVARLKSTLLFLVPDEANDVAILKDYYRDYAKLETMLKIWLRPVLPDASIAKKKAT